MLAITGGLKTEHFLDLEILRVTFERRRAERLTEEPGWSNQNWMLYFDVILRLVSAISLSIWFSADW